MEKLVEQGLCKAIGISNFTIKKITELLEGKVNIVPACNQGIEKKMLNIYCESALSYQASLQALHF